MIYENIQYRLLAFIIMFVLPTFIVTISYIGLIRKVNLNLFRFWSNLGFDTTLGVLLWPIVYRQLKWPGKVLETPWRENQANKKRNICKHDWQKCSVFWFQWGIHIKICCDCKNDRLLLQFESLASVFMLTWAPVELNNFCNVIGVTKEGFTVLYTCIWMILVTETYYHVGPDIISMKTEKEFVSKCLWILKVHNNGETEFNVGFHKILYLQNLVWISSISNSIIYIIMCGLFKNEVTRKIPKKFKNQNFYSEKTKIFNTNETKSYCALSLTDVGYLQATVKIKLNTPPTPCDWCESLILSPLDQ